MSDVALRPLRALVEAHRGEIKAIVARHRGRSVAIFGSVARGDERPGSDIDFLVELDPDARPIEILSIGVELEEAPGGRVGGGTPQLPRAVRVTAAPRQPRRARRPPDVLAEPVPL